MQTYDAQMTQTGKTIDSAESQMPDHHGDAALTETGHPSESSAEESRRERRRIVVWMVALIGLSVVPYIVGFMHSTPDWQFTGHLLPVAGDACFHMSWSKQAYEGRVLFSSQHNGAEAKTQLIFNLLFLTIGWLGRLLGIPLEMGWQLVRIGIAVLLFIALYRFTSFFIRENKWKWFALIWITTSAGFGWLEMAGLPNWWSGQGADYVASAPIDTSVAEGSTNWYMQWEIVTTPTVLLLVAAFYYSVKFHQSRQRHDLLAAATAAFLLGVVHPHNLMTVYGTLFIHLIIPAMIRRLSMSRKSGSRADWGLLVAIGAASAPTLAYYAWVLRQEPVLWNYVDAQYFFGPLQLLTGYGLPGLFAIAGTIVIFRKKEFRYSMLPAWILCGLLVLYTPIPPAGRVHGIDGLHVAICILGTRGVMQTVSWLKPSTARADSIHTDQTSRGTKIILVVILVVSSLTNVLRIANELVITSRSGQPPFMTRLMAIGIGRHAEGLSMPYSGESGAPYFLPGDLKTACHWLNTHSTQSDVVLAPSFVGTWVPYLAGNRVYFGHGYVTPKMWEREDQVERFFSFSQTNSVRRSFLKTNQIDFVIFWSGEAVSDDDPNTNRFVNSIQESHPLRLVYQNPRALIFQTTFPKP